MLALRLQASRPAMAVEMAQVEDHSASDQL